MTTPDHDRTTDHPANHDSRSAQPAGARRNQRPETLRPRIRYRPEVDLLEDRALLSAFPTLTAISASALTGEPTFTATVTDLSAGGATPAGGTVTFSDQNGVIGLEPLVDGVATFTASSLPAGTITVTATYSGTTDFAASATGTILTAVGDGTAGFAPNNDPATTAELDAPAGVAVDSAGDLFICDQENNVVREIVKASGNIITVAGNGKAGYSGDNQLATEAELNDPRDVAVDSAGDLFIADLNNNRIREVVAATGNIVTIAGNGKSGFSGNNDPAIDAELDQPRGVAVDSAGNVYFADNPNNQVREVVKSTGNIVAFAGNGTPGFSGNNDPATAAELNGPNTVAFDSGGDLFIADANNNAIREVVQSTGNIIAYAGTGKAGYGGDDGPATAAEESGATGVAVDSLGDVFFTDDKNNRVREVVKATGDIITVAGNGTAGYSGDNEPATAAELVPFRVAVDSAGDVFVADPSHNVVREFAPAVTVTISRTPTSPTPTSPTPTSPTPTSPTPTSPTPTPHTPSSTPIVTRIYPPTLAPGLTPPPAARPLPVGFLRTPPKIVRVSTKMIDRTPEIVIQLDQGIASKPALEKAWYTVEAAESNTAPGTGDDPRIAVSRVSYQAKTHTITLVMSRRPKLQGNVVLKVDARAIVNLLGQQLEGDDKVSGVNLVREVDLP